MKILSDIRNLSHMAEQAAEELPATVDHVHESLDDLSDTIRTANQTMRTLAVVALVALALSSVAMIVAGSSRAN